MYMFQAHHSTGIPMGILTPESMDANAAPSKSLGNESTHRTTPHPARPHSSPHEILRPHWFAHAPYANSGIIIAEENAGWATQPATLSQSGRFGAAGSVPLSLRVSKGTERPHPSEKSFSAIRGTSSGGRKNRDTARLECRHYVKGKCTYGNACHFAHTGPIHRTIQPHPGQSRTEISHTPLHDLAKQEKELKALPPPEQSSSRKLQSLPWHSAPQLRSTAPNSENESTRSNDGLSTTLCPSSCASRATPFRVASADSVVNIVIRTPVPNSLSDSAPSGCWVVPTLEGAP